MAETVIFIAYHIFSHLYTINKNDLKGDNKCSFRRSLTQKKMASSM